MDGWDGMDGTRFSESNGWGSCVPGGRRLLSRGAREDQGGRGGDPSGREGGLQAALAAHCRCQVGSRFYRRHLEGLVACEIPRIYVAPAHSCPGKSPRARMEALSCPADLERGCQWSRPLEPPPPRLSPGVAVRGFQAPVRQTDSTRLPVAEMHPCDRGSPLEIDQRCRGSGTWIWPQLRAEGRSRAAPRRPTD